MFTVVVLPNVEAAIFRSVGDTKVPLKTLVVSGIINVILNLFFVIVLKMTVNGVAIAIVISNLISAIILLNKLIKTDQYIHVNLKDLKIYKLSLVRILKIRMPAGIQSAVFALANIVIQAAINSLGTVVIAASSAAFNVEIFAYDILNSFWQACTTFVGQNYGAGQIDRCKKTLYLCLIEDAIASALAIGIIIVSCKFLLSLFNNNPQVIQIGYTRLIMVFTAYIFSMLCEVMSGYLRGFGISLVPTILTCICICGTRVLWIEIVFKSYQSFTTIMCAYPLSLSLTSVAILCALMYYRPSKKMLNKD
ncbi:MATE family efflux transporter [Faecalibacillus intestinalis]|jgi:Na+-driven multidrug efflux pump